MTVERLVRTVPVAVCALAGFLAASPAEAKIDCLDGFQKVQGSRIATPYCQDALVARVAAGYGINAPAAKIRNNPNFKRHVCRLVGQDIRIKETCAEVNPYGRGRF
ncbi:hypothetical protein [Hyphomicrobium methylovorum]|uniref:hypothetical protein n=1 Tax=Hyphomicrobium methylovorum TaxID=84 RepID=UPI0015E630F8|nr:hypothetical protein [Hyphomicrobium methylovorum]